MSSFIYNTIGLFGDVLVLIAYTLLHVHKMQANSFMYSLLNLIGAAFVLFSLYFSWNLPSAFIEGAWIIVSFYGIIKAMTKKAIS